MVQEAVNIRAFNLPRHLRPILFCIFLSMCSMNMASAQVTADASLPESVRAIFQVVGTQVYSVVTEMFHGNPPLDLPIVIVLSSPPRTMLDDWAKPTSIRIGTTLTEPRLDQFVYQFSHEMGHVMLDPRRNSGFVDAICTALSLAVLSRFNMGGYRKLNDTESMQSLPLEITSAVAAKDWTKVRSYLHDHRSEMEPDSPTYRPVQYLAALSILSGPVDWGALKGIAGCTEPGPNKDPSFRILQIKPGCMTTVSDLDCRIGANCQR